MDGTGGDEGETGHGADLGCRVGTGSDGDRRVQRLGKSDVERAFAEMGEILYRAKKVAEIAVFGGAAILLQFEAEFRTGDVGAKVETGDHGAVLDAARIVAERHGGPAAALLPAAAA